MDLEVIYLCDCAPIPRVVRTSFWSQHSPFFLVLKMFFFKSIFVLQDSDGEAGIALVGVHSDFPKYGAGPVDEKCPNSNGGATVGYDSDDNDDGDDEPSSTQTSTQCLVSGNKFDVVSFLFVCQVYSLAGIEITLQSTFIMSLIQSLYSRPDPKG